MNPSDCFLGGGVGVVAAYTTFADESTRLPHTAYTLPVPGEDNVAACKPSLSFLFYDSTYLGDFVLGGWG